MMGRYEEPRSVNLIPSDMDKSVAEQILKVADLEFNLTEKRVRRNGLPIYLTVFEMQLLEFLLRRKNQIVTKSDIVVNLMEVELNTELIPAYIEKLKSKIDFPFLKSILKIKEGRGFSISDN